MPINVQTGEEGVARILARSAVSTGERHHCGEGRSAEARSNVGGGELTRHYSTLLMAAKTEVRSDEVVENSTSDYSQDSCSDRQNPLPLPPTDADPAAGLRLPEEARRPVKDNRPQGGIPPRVWPVKADATDDSVFEASAEDQRAADQHLAHHPLGPV